MSVRFGLSLVLVAVAMVQTGYAIHKTPWPCGRTYYGMQCGCLYWHEWFSHKPCCCDPCNQCGQFTASKNPYVVTGPRYTRFGEVYSDGSGSNRPGAIGELYDSPSGQQPTPARPPAGVLDEEGPIPSESLPGPGPTTRLRPSGRTAMGGAMVEPMPASRTLGRPPRERLFTR
jgi:hypothetical protein